MSSLLNWPRLLAILLLIGCTVLVGCENSKDKAQSHYENGLELVEQNKLVKAKLEFRNTLKLDKEHTSALFELGNVEFAQKNYVGAVRIFLGVAEADPKHVVARVNLARIFLLANKMDDALKFADEAYALDSKHVNVLAIKAALAIRQKSYEDAIRFAEAALQADANSVDALMVLAAERVEHSDPKGALAFLERGIAGEEKNLGLQVFKIKVLEQLNDLQGIEQTLVRLSVLYPSQLAIHNNLAKWYLRRDDKDAAEDVVRKYLSNNPDDEKAGSNLVGFVRNQRGIAEAEKELSALINTSSSDSFDYNFALAELIYEKGDTEKANEYLRKLIADNGGNENGVKAQLFLARRLLSQNKQEEALSLAESVIADDAKNVDALLVRASIKTTKNNYPSAIEDLRNALNEEPRSVNILQALATVYERNGQIVLAEENLAKAVEIQEFKGGTGLELARFLVRYGKPKRAESVLGNVIQKTPGDEDALKQLAQLKLGRGDWQGAGKIAETLAKVNDNNKLFVNRVRAQVLAGQNQIDKSIRILQEAALDDPSDVSPTADLFRLYVRSKKFDAAEELVNSELETNPSNVLAHVRMGFLHNLQNNIDAAEASYKKAIEVDKVSGNGHYALASFYSREARFEEAEKTVRDGLALNKRSLPMQLLLANILEVGQNYEEAISVYEDMYLAEPRSLIVANNLASLLSEFSTNSDSLQKAYDIAYSRFRNSNVPQFLDTLGWIHVKREEFGDAVSHLRKAAEGLPNNGVVQFHLGMAYKGLGRDELAIASLKKAEALMKNQDLREKDVLMKSLKELSE
ncbi:MAG: tetratricopeptide repeat protein [Rhizobiaceae bacterium]